MAIEIKNLRRPNIQWPVFNVELVIKAKCRNQRVAALRDLLWISRN